MQIFIAHSVQLGEKPCPPPREVPLRDSWLANALEIGHAPVEARNDPASPQSSSRLIGRSSETHHRSEGDFNWTSLSGDYLLSARQDFQYLGVFDF